MCCFEVEYVVVTYTRSGFFSSLPCEAMQFYVSARGQVTADTLCRFDEVQIPADAFVEERATVSDLYQCDL